MIKPLRSKTVDPITLSESEKEVFIDELYSVHRQIFSGVSKEEFVLYVVDPPARYTRVNIFRNSNNEAVGYFAVHFFDRTLNNTNYTIMRAESGILREYRGSSISLIIGFEEALKYRFLHPFKQLYYLGTFVHPRVYRMFGKFFQEIYPDCNNSIPESSLEFMLALVGSFNVPAIDKDSPLVRDVGWITINSTEEKKAWQKDQDIWVRNYIRQNPDYGRGYGLTVLVPLTLKNMITSLANYLQKRLLYAFSRNKNISG